MMPMPLHSLDRIAQAALALSLAVGLVACQVAPTQSAPTALPTAAIVVVATPATSTPPAPTAPPAPALGYLGAEPIPAEIVSAAADLGLSLGASETIDALRGAEVLVSSAPERNGDVLTGGAVYPVLIGADAPPEGGLALDPTNLRADHAGFLLGLTAGLATEYLQVGVVSAGTAPETLAYRNGFLSGVRYSCATCLIDIFDLPELSDAAVATSQGGQFATYGSDVIFVAPAPAASDMLQALVTNGIFVLGGEIDMIRAFGVDVNAWPETALAAARADLPGALAHALRLYAAGTPPTGVQPLSLANAGLTVSPLHDPRGLISGLDQRDLDAATERVRTDALDVGVDPVTGEPK